MKDILVTCIDQRTQTQFEVRIPKVSITIFSFHPFRIGNYEGGITNIKNNVMDATLEAIRDQAIVSTDPPKGDIGSQEILVNSLRIFSSKTNEEVRKRLIPNNDSNLVEWKDLYNAGVLVTTIQLGPMTVESKEIKDALAKIEKERMESISEARELETVLNNAAKVSEFNNKDALHTAMLISGKVLPDQRVIIVREGGSNLSGPEALAEATLLHKFIKEGGK
jgi:hypothetical protein